MRIQMHQVGARDEARLVADFETCGQEVCCKRFLKVLRPVNMGSAKMQKATLDPSKISGRCGRLKCCLRYEEDTYDELRKKLPRVGRLVRIADGVGVVEETMILTQLVRVRLENDRIVAVANEEILERDIPESALRQRRQQEEREPREGREPTDGGESREPRPMPEGSRKQARRQRPQQPQEEAADRPPVSEQPRRSQERPIERAEPEAPIQAEDGEAEVDGRAPADTLPGGEPTAEAGSAGGGGQQGMGSLGRRRRRRGRGRGRGSGAGGAASE
jgi:hypothetical protein